MISKIRAWIKLVSAPRIGAGKAKNIIDELGEPENYIDKKESLLSDIEGISTSAIEFLETDQDPPDWKNIKDLINRHNIHFTTILDEKYPKSLKRINNPPLFLFYRGDFREDDFRRNLAIVGTRRPSSYGEGQCIKIVGELVKRGFTIISGLAYGIDSIAHKATLDNRGKTIAVLGCGLDQVYPSSNKNLAEAIIENGALISEQIPGSKINPWNFANRNRIISGMSSGSWIVEGKLKSGALITAENANEQQKRLFALPGDITRETAAGPNHLISMGAVPVLGYKSILDGLNICDESEQLTIDVFDNMNEEEKKLYQILMADNNEMTFDKLMISSGLPISKLSTLLLSMELKGLVRKAAGNKIYPIK